MKSGDEACLDILREIATIGAGNAAAAMSKMVGRRVNIKMPDARHLSIEKAPTIMGKSEVVIAVFNKFDGDRPGSLFLLLDEENALALLGLMLNRKVKKVGELECSAILEIGNIITGNFLSAVANFLDVLIRPTPPAMKVDMFGAVLDIALAEYGKFADSAWIVDVKFLVEAKCKGHLLLIPLFSLMDELSKRVKERG